MQPSCTRNTVKRYGTLRDNVHYDQVDFLDDEFSCWIRSKGTEKSKIESWTCNLLEKSETDTLG